MNPVFDQVRRLFDAIAQPYKDQHGVEESNKPPSKTSTQLITTEKIEAVMGGGFYRVLGESVPISGLSVLQAGQLVPVGWKNGKPALILEHTARRAQFFNPPPSGVGGIEELFLFKDGTAYDVFYRNGQQVTRLNLTAFLPATTETLALSGLGVDIGWGVDGKAFFVRLWETQTSGFVTPYYVIFSLKPNSPRGNTTVVAALVKTLHTLVKTLPPYKNDGSGGIVTFTGMGTNGLGVSNARSAILSETLEMYVSATLFLETETIDATASAQIDAIFRVSDSAIVYSDPILTDYQAQQAGIVSNENLLMTNALSILSWSDKDTTKRQWFSSAVVLDTGDTGSTILQSSHTEKIFRAGSPLILVASGAEYALGPIPPQPRIGWPTLLIPEMSGEKYATIDTPTAWTADSTTAITTRTIAMVDLTLRTTTPIWSWIKANDNAKFNYAPKLHGLQMLQPKYLYAFPESPWTLTYFYSDQYSHSATGIPANTLTADEQTLTREQQNFVAFTSGAGVVNGNFLVNGVLSGLTLDGALAQQAKVSAVVTPVFRTVLNNSATPPGSMTNDKRVLVRRRFSPF